MLEQFAKISLTEKFVWSSPTFDLSQYLLFLTQALRQAPLHIDHWIPFLQYKWEGEMAKLLEEPNLSTVRQFNLRSISAWLSQLSNEALEGRCSWEDFGLACRKQFPAAASHSSLSNKHLAWQGLQLVGNAHPMEFVNAFVYAVRLSFNIPATSSVHDSTYRHCWQMLLAALLHERAHNPEWRSGLFTFLAEEHRQAVLNGTETGPMAIFENFMSNPSLAIIEKATLSASDRHVCACPNPPTAQSTTSKPTAASSSATAPGSQAPANRNTPRPSSTQRTSATATAAVSTEGPDSRPELRWLATRQECIANKDKYPESECYRCRAMGHATRNCPDRKDDKPYKNRFNPTRSK
jgi:hypothetical protein